jgi:hypothetical protein
VTAETERGLALVEAMVSREQRGPDRVFVAGDASAEVWLPRSRMTELPLVPVGAGLAGLPSVPMQPRVTELPSVLAQARLAVGLPSFPAEAEGNVFPLGGTTKAEPHIRWFTAVVNPVPP